MVAAVLTRAHTVKVYGTPAPKGSMKCVGRRGRRMHVLVEDNHATKPWRTVIAQAGLVLRTRAGHQLDGPLGVWCVVTLPLPASVKPETRLWPYTQSPGHGDIDKLERTILDGLGDAHLFGNDAQVCELFGRKVYSHTPTEGVLDRPGALLRVYPL